MRYNVVGYLNYDWGQENAPPPDTWLIKTFNTKEEAEVFAKSVIEVFTYIEEVNGL